MNKHVHKLKRHTYTNKEQVYFCVLDCKFKVKRELALGKSNICWRCGREFNLNEYSIRLAKPHCDLCTKTKVELPSDVLESFARPQPSYSNSINKESTNDLLSLRERLGNPIGSSDETDEENEPDLL
jgi:hypothetical protein